jgi:Cell wall-active antibiotics response LiaF, C-terminal
VIAMTENGQDGPPQADEHEARRREGGVPGAERRLTLMGGLSRHGRWTMHPRTLLVTAIGGADLDLTDAVLASTDLTLTVGTLVGGVRVTVPPDVDVVVEGVRVFGGHHVEPGVRPVRARLTIRSFGLVGGVRVLRSDTAAGAQG